MTDSRVSSKFEPPEHLFTHWIENNKIPFPGLISPFFLFSSPNCETGLPEWGIVELQGDLEVRENQIMSGQFVGDLCYNKYGQPVT